LQQERRFTFLLAPEYEMNTEDTKKSSSVSRKRSGGSEFASSLDSYLSSVGKISGNDQNEQTLLTASIDALQLEIGSVLARFGFTAGEYCRILDDCCAAGSSPEDYFLSSSLKQGNPALPQNMMELLRKWKEEIKAAHCSLEEKFTSGGECSQERKTMAELVERYRPNGMLVEELYQIATGYSQLNPENTGLSEARFLMAGDELEEALSELRALNRKLARLHTRMAETNLRLVISIANKYRECSVPLNDIIQEGNLGLMVAVQRFDFNLGNRFSTYAGWWIKHYILRAVAEQSRVVRLPLHIIQAIQNMNRAEQRFIQNNGREPDNSELAALLEMPTARVSAMRKMASQSISLQASVNSEDNSQTLEDLIAPEEKSEPWRNYARKLLYEKLYEMLNNLPERERQIIIYRFGLCGEAVLPLCEISSRLNLSRERVRQLENKVMAQLRSKEYLKFIDGLSHIDD
jgi:RNA polymerase primary sigma factor